jgi:hypothetical protein
MDKPMKIFSAIWVMVVISVLTIFALCKIGGAWFNMPPSDKQPTSNAQRIQEMYHDCLSETNGHNTNNCNEVLKGVK